MSDAPERIWAWPGNRGWYAAECSSEVNLGLCQPESDQQQKYIRADLVDAKDARIAELEDVVNKLWRRQDSLDTFNSAVNAILTPLFKKQGEQNDD